MAQPHIHHPIRYCYGPDEPALQAMPHARYQIADQLKTQPPGTVAKTQGDWLVMVDVGGELLMLRSPDLRPGSTSANHDLMAHHLLEFTDPMDFRQASPKVNTPYSPVEYLNLMDELFGASEDQRPAVWSGHEAAAQQRAAQTLFRTPGAR
ncbi:hypothetical protein [Pseudomonas aeruginosa]|uniref:hypothetical protein n=1 Tax=Pseudomonas aeruginosa TaxID=287 RepID=UPI002238F62E|nr:hypothetical protein [Pseudomonas aeruginosa]MCW4647207.1 hypothetical protein [Pseudomonas aeruginosa]